MRVRILLRSVAHTEAIGLTSLQAEHPVPRSRLWNASGTASSSTSGPRPKAKSSQVPVTGWSSVDSSRSDRPRDILKY